MSKQPLTPEQVLQDIQSELTQPTATFVGGQSAFMRQLTEARQQAQQFRAHPVLGALAGLKKLIYGLSHSTFSQQYDLNDTLINLIDELYGELATQREQLRQLELRSKDF